MRGTCVARLIALMDVSLVRLSILSLQWIMAHSGDCLILPFCCLHIYDLMLLSSSWIWAKIRPISNICQLDVSDAFSTKMHQSFFPRYCEDRLHQAVKPSFYPPTVKILTRVHLGGSETFSSMFSECDRRIRLSDVRLMLQNTENVRNSQECNSARSNVFTRSLQHRILGLLYPGRKLLSYQSNPRRQVVFTHSLYIVV